jgi:drug/metabolite transporter (DMT)-like permease
MRLRQGRLAGAEIAGQHGDGDRAASFLFGSTFFNFGAEDAAARRGDVDLFFAPMVITALAGPLLGEWAGWRRWLAVFVGFIGVLVITRPGFAAFGSAMSMRCARR